MVEEAIARTVESELDAAAPSRQGQEGSFLERAYLFWLALARQFRCQTALARGAGRCERRQPMHRPGLALFDEPNL